MSGDAKQPACSEDHSELVVTVVASLELPIHQDAPSAPAATRFADVETAAAPIPSLPVSIQSVIEDAIRNADDDVEGALIEALRSTQR